MINLNPPSIAGNWNFTETSVKDGQETIYTPVCIKNNIVYKIDGINFEAGTDPSNKDQVASVAYSTGIRVKDAKKNDLKK